VITRKQIATGILFSICLMLFVSSVKATTDEVGSTTSNTGFDGQLSEVSIVASASGTLTQICVNVEHAGGGSGEVAIYDNTGGSAGSSNVLLTNSTSQALADGWDCMNVGSVSIVSSTTYNLAFQQTSGATAIYYDTSEGRNICNGFGYQDFPNPFGCTDGKTQTLNMRMIYTASASFLFTNLISPTNTTYTTEPNITFLINSSKTSAGCNWNLNAYMTKNVNVTVQNITQESDFITGNVGGLNGTNSLQLDCANSTLVNSSSVVFTINLGTQTPLLYGIRIRFPEGDSVVRMYVH
jgi:hypothetical protein